MNSKNHSAPSDQSWFNPWLWPGCLLAIAIVLLNAAAWLGWRLGAMMPYVLVGLGAMALFLIVRGTRRDWRIPAGAVLALLASWLAVSDAAQDLFPTNYVSAHPDAWSYNAVSDYLADHGRGLTTNLSLPDQYSTHLKDSRISSSCLLALFRQVVGGNNVFAVHTAFAVVLFFVAYGSMAALAGIFGFTRAWSNAAAMLFVLLGWATNALIVGNYDNLCFVVLLPGAVALVLGLKSDGSNTWARTPVLALYAAALAYTYPEGVIISALAIVPILIFAYHKSSNRRLFLSAAAVTVLLALFLWAPYAPYFLQFLMEQVHHAAYDIAQTRAGAGNFIGLLDHRFLPSLFALGTEYPSARADWWSNIVAGALAAMTLWGSWLTSKRYPWLPYSFIIAGLLVCFQAFVSRYDYLMYKAIFCHAWIFTPVLVEACRSLTAKLSRPAAMFILWSLLAVIFAERWRHREARVWAQTGSRSALLDLYKINSFTARSTLFLELHEGFNQLWAVSILREQPLIVMERLSYLAMPHVQSKLSQASFDPVGPDAFILTDRPVSNALWHNDRFSLVRSDGAVFTKVANPNGVEQVDGQPFVWIGHSRETVLHIYAAREGKFTLGGRAWWVGQSLPETNVRTLILRDSAGERRIPVESGPPNLTIHLKPGDNIISLRIAERPSLAAQSDGDQRELMLGFLGYFLKPGTE